MEIKNVDELMLRFSHTLPNAVWPKLIRTPRPYAASCAADLLRKTANFSETNVQHPRQSKPVVAQITTGVLCKPRGFAITCIVFSFSACCNMLAQMPLEYYWTYTGRKWTHEHLAHELCRFLTKELAWQLIVTMPIVGVIVFIVYKVSGFWFVVSVQTRWQ